VILETPAGQGTELLRTWEEFFGFVRRFGGDPRLRVCIDTCHVFAAGEDPVVYVERAIRECEPGLVRLIHFNDSKGAAGSCVDRHEFVGAGHIGLARMTAIAVAASAAGIPCVYE
jgi:deoxyribonuclease-4